MLTTDKVENTNENLFKLEEFANTAKGLASLALAISQAMNEGGLSSDAYNGAVAYYESLISDFAKELNAVVNSIREANPQNKTNKTDE